MSIKSATNPAISCTTAYAVAARIVERMRPACERIQIAGSIRRCKPLVKDIEIVVIPSREVMLFDSCLLGMMQGTVPMLKPGRCDGEKYKQFMAADLDFRPLCNLDLFIVTPETWAIQLAIRTGPASYSKRLVTEQRFGGLLKDGYYIERGMLWLLPKPDNHFFCTTKPIVVETERDFLDGFAGGWVDPEDR